MDSDSVPPVDDQSRCTWANEDDLMAYYHDVEWGTPPESDNGYFEALTLESFQSGLSWRTILHRREGFRKAFAGFSIPVVASFTQQEVETLIQDEGIIRHRGKIEAAIHNARFFQQIHHEAGSFSNWLAQMPEDSAKIHASLRPHLRFFGPTTCESFLMAVGKITPVHDPECWKSS